MVINVFGKGLTIAGKTSSRLNLPSQSLDCRKKENASYRTGKMRVGQLSSDGASIIWQSGEVEPR